MSKIANQRTRVPTEVMEASGAFQRNPARAARRVGEVQYSSMDFDRVPAELTPEAARVWNELADTYGGNGAVCAADATLLCLVATTVAELRSAQAIVAAEGLTVETPKGGYTAHPLLPHIRAMRAQVKTLLAEMGWTPVSRSKVQAPAEEEPEDEFSQMLQ